MKAETKPLPRRLALPLLALLLTGCAATPQELSPPAPSCPVIPALPTEARQPAAPPWCSPDCSTGLSLEIESWRKDLTMPAAQD